jgi:hypothetical protein
MSNPFPKKRRTPKRLTVEDIDALIEKHSDFARMLAAVGYDFSNPATENYEEYGLYEKAGETLAQAARNAGIVNFLKELKYEMLYDVDADD